MTTPLVPIAEARTYTRAELDRGTCSDCGKPHAVMGVGPKCHLRAPMHAQYVRATGQLVLTCSVCGTGAAVIQIAWAVPS